MIRDEHRRCPTCSIIIECCDPDFDVRAMNRLSMASSRLSSAWTTVRQLDTITQEDKDKLAEARIVIDNLTMKMAQICTEKAKANGAKFRKSRRKNR